jgi:hypothetical protein
MSDTGGKLDSLAEKAPDASSVAPEELLRGIGPPADKEIAEGVVLCASFDLINSTKYKRKYKDRWPEEIWNFYDLVVGAVHDHKHTLKPQFQSDKAPTTEPIRVWKYIGDEVLFWVPVKQVSTLVETLVPGFHSALTRVDAVMSERTQDDDVRLAVKGAMWIARVRSAKSGELDAGKRKPVPGEPENIIFKMPLESGADVTDFLGPDIDTGFRIAAHSSRRTMVISVELAYALWEKAPEANVKHSFRIVDLKQLKGVWEDRYYPIIWYRGDWGPELHEVLDYDEHCKVPIVRKALTAAGRAFDPEKLKKALRSVKKLDGAEKIILLLDDDQKTKAFYDRYANLDVANPVLQSKIQ